MTISRTCRGAAAAALILGLLATTGHALTVTETTDWGNIASANAALGPLSVGTNTITGNISCERVNEGPNDFGGFDTWCEGDTNDYFNFDVLAGTQLTAVSVEVTNFETVGEKKGAHSHSPLAGCWRSAMVVRRTLAMDRPAICWVFHWVRAPI